MERIPLFLDFAAKVAWPGVALVATVALWKPARSLLASLAERVGTDLESATLPGVSATFGRRSIDTKVIEAAKESGKEQAKAGILVTEEAFSRAVVRAYVRALAGAFLDWYEDEAFEDGDPEAEHNRALLDWIRGPGNALVTRYDIFERLCDALRERKWTIEPTPSVDDFEKASGRTVQRIAMKRALRKIERRAQREAEDNMTPLIKALRDRNRKRSDK